MTIIIILCIILILISPLVRLIITNPHNICFYSVLDIYEYFKYKKWRDFNYYGIDMYVGMFGHGKTLSMTHTVRRLYERYGNRLRIFSNYDLIGIPYIPLVNFNQLVDIGEEEDCKYVGTVVLIDEIENVLSHRNFANFPLELLHMLTQQRKKHVYILCSAQRFFMVDKLFRSITTNVYDCNKFWRFQNHKRYDAWDYENAVNPELVRCSGNSWWFVKNSDYASYDTSAMVRKGMAEDFISNEEAIVRKGLDYNTNENAIRNPSKKLNKVRKNNRRK